MREINEQKLGERELYYIKYKSTGFPIGSTAVVDLSEGLKCGQSKGLGDLVQKFIHGFGGEEQWQQWHGKMA